MKNYEATEMVEAITNINQCFEGTNKDMDLE